MFFKLNPLFTSVVEIDKSLIDTGDKRDLLIDAAKAEQCHLIHDLGGNVENRSLLVFSSENVSNKFIKDGTFNFQYKKTEYHAKLINVYAANKTSTIDPTNVQSKDYMRKIRYFSGRDKISAGECDVFEWTACAQDIVNSTENVVPKDKIDYLKN